MVHIKLPSSYVECSSIRGFGAIIPAEALSNPSNKGVGCGRLQHIRVRSLHRPGESISTGLVGIGEHSRLRRSACSRVFGIGSFMKLAHCCSTRAPNYRSPFPPVPDCTRGQAPLQETSQSSSENDDKTER